MRRTILFVLLVSSVLLGCTNVEVSRFLNLPSEERDGMTLSVLDIECSEQRTVIKTQFSFQPNWELDENILPSANFYQALLFNQEGYIYHPVESSSGRPFYDASTDRLVVNLEVVVEGAACEAERLTFELTVVLLEIRADRPIVIDLSNHEIGDEWIVNDVVSFNGLIATLERAKLTTRHQLRNDVLHEYPTLEIHIAPLANEVVELRCAYFGIPINDTSQIARGSRGCLYTDHIISYTMIGEPVPQGEPITFAAAPIEFAVTGDLLLKEPWRLSWNANDEG